MLLGFQQEDNGIYLQGLWHRQSSSVFLMLSTIPFHLEDIHSPCQPFE